MVLGLRAWVFEGCWVFFLVVGCFGNSCVLKGALRFYKKTFIAFKKKKKTFFTVNLWALGGPDLHTQYIMYWNFKP